jgi:hypothetical protein
MDRIEMTADQLDVVIAEVARRAPHVLPILRGVRAGAHGYAVLGDRSLILRQSRQPSRRDGVGAPRSIATGDEQAASLPMVVLVPDAQGRGPDGFSPKLIRMLVERSCAVLLVTDEQPDDAAYGAAAVHCVERNRHVLLVETHRGALPAWVQLAYAAGKAEADVVVVTADPDQPAGLQQMDVDELAKAPAPARPVH